MTTIGAFETREELKAGGNFVAANMKSREVSGL